MMDIPDVVQLSPVDEQRFGVRIARTSEVTFDNLSSILGFCEDHRVEMLIARCSTNDSLLVHKLEELGFVLMDTLVYCTRKLTSSPIPEDTCDFPVRLIKPGEEHAVKKVAGDAYQGYQSHYHSDPRLDPAKCVEGYMDWAYQSCVSREVADDVLVVEMDGKIAGFFAMRKNSPEEGTGVVSGVAPFAQGRGIYRSFMINTMNWLLRAGADRMVVSTQVTNIAVQKSWVRLGFEPLRSLYTFHKWFAE